MSARQQAGQLKAILAKNVKKSRVKAAMAQTLINNGQVASGALVRAIISINENRVFRISYKINKEFDVIYDVFILGNDRGRISAQKLIESKYAGRIDTVAGKDPTSMSPPISAIDVWISQKLKNGTWKGGNMYITKRGEKTYSYPLSNPKYRKKLAYIIARGIKNRGYLKNRSPYLTEGNLRLELAYFDSKREFEALWSDQLANILDNKITALF